MMNRVNAKACIMANQTCLERRTNKGEKYVEILYLHEYEYPSFYIPRSIDGLRGGETANRCALSTTRAKTVRPSWTYCCSVACLYDRESIQTLTCLLRLGVEWASFWITGTETSKFTFKQPPRHLSKVIGPTPLVIEDSISSLK
jgi:hypothetical protein